MDPSGPLEVRASEGVIYTHTPDNGKSRPSKAQKEKDNRCIRKLFKGPGHIDETTRRRSMLQALLHKVRNAALIVELTGGGGGGMESDGSSDDDAGVAEGYGSSDDGAGVAEGEGADGEEVPGHVAEGEGADQQLRMESDGSPR